LKRNNNIALLADLLGHSGVNITQIYLRQSQEQQQDAVNKAVNW
jgi:site-specific recombinase XerD